MTIPNSVESIDEYSLSYCANLATIDIASSVTHIKSYAFAHTTSLGSVDIPDTIKVIADCKLFISTRQKPHARALATNANTTRTRHLSLSCGR